MYTHPHGFQTLPGLKHNETTSTYILIDADGSVESNVTTWPMSTTN